MVSRPPTETLQRALGCPGAGVGLSCTLPPATCHVQGPRDLPHHRSVHGICGGAREPGHQQRRALTARDTSSR